MMKKGFLPVCAVVLLLCSALSTARAKTEFFKVDDLRPGMKGVGRTCYQGTKPEEFQAEILGVLRGANPGASIVLARFSGAALDKTGIFEGMSGSPVYIDGKLLGAVAYSFSFTKEPIGGITPITEMVAAFDEPIVPSSGTKIADNRSFKSLAPSAARRALSAESLAEAAGSRSGPMEGRSLTPIATPLSIGGFHSETLKVFAPRFRAMGMSVFPGAAGGSAAQAGSGALASGGAPLEPGSNIVIPLVRGDLEVSAGGTVTYVDGNRVYAFGHSLLQLGYIEMPIHQGRAILVVPSLESSFKILEIGEPVGTLRQDRGSGIYGVLGEMPRMVPLEINLTTSRGGRKAFKFDVVRDAFLTPLLVNSVVYNTIIASERAQGSVALDVKGKITVKNEPPIEIANRFSSESGAPSDAALSIAIPVNYLMAAGYANLDLQKINLDVSIQELDRTAILDSIRFSHTEVRAGESLDLEIACRKANGELIQNTYPIQIPANVSPGALTMLVADGTTLMALDEIEEGSVVIPRDLSQLVKFLNNLRKNDHLYLRFFRQEPGAIMKGEGMPGLPPSILSILKSERKVGALSSINTSTLMEFEMPDTEYVVSGAKTLKLIVKP